MATNFITNTPSLKTTIADVRRLNTKKIVLNGEDLTTTIKNNKTTVLDERGTNADDDLDIWNSYIIKDEEGNVVVDMTPTPKEHDIYTVTDEQLSVLRSCSKVINNEVLDADDNHLMYWQTDGLNIGGYFGIFTDGDDLTSLYKSIMYFENLNSGEFIENNNLTTFNSKLSSLTDGTIMFYCCYNLTTFNSDLSSLMNGNQMFSFCSSLESFTSDLSSLTYGGGMFSGCSNLTTFKSNLSSLTDGNGMFGGCSSLTTFTSDLSSLTNGGGMFYNCSSLESFTSDLSSLTNGSSMFSDCKLDAKSVANIITFLPTHESQGTILIGIGIPNTEEAKQAFAEECYCDSWEELNQDFSNKNWEVQWQFNGPASYSLRDPRPSTAVFAKLEEVFMPTEQNKLKPHYQYTSQDATKFYNISWYHDSNMENEGYDYFESLEEAISAYGVIPK